VNNISLKTDPVTS